MKLIIVLKICDNRRESADVAFSSMTLRKPCAVGQSGGGVSMEGREEMKKASLSLVLCYHFRVVSCEAVVR